MWDPRLVSRVTWDNRSGSTTDGYHIRGVLTTGRQQLPASRNPCWKFLSPPGSVREEQRLIGGIGVPKSEAGERGAEETAGSGTGEEGGRAAGDHDGSGGIGNGHRGMGMGMGMGGMGWDGWVGPGWREEVGDGLMRY